MLLVTFAGLVVAHWFGFTALKVPESAQNSVLNIVMVGVGGYLSLGAALRRWWIN